MQLPEIDKLIMDLDTALEQIKELAEDALMCETDGEDAANLRSTLQKILDICKRNEVE